MMTPAFGEFLHPAAGHITAAVCDPGDLPADARDAAVGELGRLITILARYLADLPMPDEFDPALHRALKPEAQAAGEARQALQWAAASLPPKPGPPQSIPPGAGHPVVQHLSAAADLLAAGRDLLHTHFTADQPPRAQAANSYWAPVITSWPITSAMVSEVTTCARLLAPWAAHLAATSQDPATPTAASAGLNNASRWLRAAGAAVHAAQQQPPTAEARELLAAIPLNTPPHAQPVRQTEPVPRLCDGITVTAGRLRYAARAFAPTARWAPESTSLSWRRDALASAITTHSSAFILRRLTERASQLAYGTDTQTQLRSAAALMDKAWPAWHKVACQWDTITTGRHPPGSLTPTAAEIGDLALRIGRLARRDPHWTPARTGLGLIRNPASLAPSPGDLSAVLAAVHHATDALVRIASEDRQAIRDAAADRRLYLPAHLLPADDQNPRQHVSIRWPRARRLLATYTAAIEATTRTLIALDKLAITTGAPSRSLAQARTLKARPAHDELTAPNPRATGPGPHDFPQPAPGAIGQVIRDLHITEPATLLRATAIDQAAQALTARASVQAQRRAAALDSPTGPADCLPCAPALQHEGQQSARPLPQQPRARQPPQGRQRP
jgi:hypothetical protein